MRLGKRTLLVSVSRTSQHKVSIGGRRKEAKEERSKQRRQICQGKDRAKYGSEKMGGLRFADKIYNGKRMVSSKFVA